MCACARACQGESGGGDGGGKGSLYTRLNTGDLRLGGGCLVEGTLAGDGGTTELVAVSAFSGTLYRTNEQRSEAHFYTLLGTLPCQSFPPLALEWVFLFLSFFSTPHSLLVQFQHMSLENRQWENKMRSAESFFFCFIFCDGFSFCFLSRLHAAI